MTVSDQKSDLRMYLQRARDVMVWKLDGLSDYDIRRPLTPTGTNLLGLVKHLTVEEFGYFGMTFERLHPALPPWASWPNPVPNSHLWATEQESRDYIVGWYRKGCAHADETIDALELDAIGHVPWWRGERSEVNLHRILVHMIVETNRHAGHADIVRELIDGSAGLREGVSNLPSNDPAWWRDYRDRLEQVAASAGRS